MNTLRTLLLLVLTIARIRGLPDGAPPNACATLEPIHPGASVQSSFPSYQILASAGQGRVRLILGSNEGLAYEGFMIVAKDAQTGEFVGEFSNLPDTAKAVECTPNIKNGVTHSNKSKKHNLELDWQAPADYEGTVIFNSTFAQDYATYWVGVESPRITVLQNNINVLMSTTKRPHFRTSTSPYYETPTTEAAKLNDPFYDGCGSNKICFGTEDGCLETEDCKAAVAVLVRGERYLFELQSRGSKYVAVGLSEDRAMGGDSVVECVNEGNKVGVHMSWNQGKTNIRHSTPPNAIQVESAEFKDGILSCKFYREKETTVHGQKFNLVNTPYHILIAAGEDASNTQIGYHNVRQGTSETKLLSDVSELKAASNILVRIHGALMVASWIGTASIGMLLARYYRQTWVGSRLCGKDQWFAWHRFFMFLTWLMTIAGFVVIFVELEHWSSETIHASLGLATTLLCFIQPFMAAIRPDPGAAKRPLFNWVHWLVGNAAHVCGIIAIFFATKLNKAELPEWVIWIIVAYVVFHVLTHLFLTFAGCASDRQSSQRVNSFPMKDMHSRNSMSHADSRRDAPHSGLRKLTFGVYFVVITLLSAALIVIAVLAPIEDSWQKVRASFN